MLREERQERRRADLLLALDEHRHPDGEVADLQEGAQRAEVGHDARLVVGRAAAVETAVALGRLERVGLPRAGVARGLDVVVRVQQDGRGAVGRRAARDDGGRALGAVLGPGAQHLDLGQSGVAQERGHGVGAGGDVRLVERGVRDARHAHERLQVGAQRREEPGDGLAERGRESGAGRGGGGFG